MDTVQIAPDDITTNQEFSEGNPVQVRVTVKDADGEDHYQKGSIVKVLHDNNQEDGAVIVSDPIVISHDLDTKSKVLSLIVEQSSE